MTLTKLHPLSVLLGLALALALSALTSFGAGDRGDVDKSMRISLDPDPESIVQIAEGDSFTVPRGRILLIKSIDNASQIFGRATVRVNGVQVATAEVPQVLGFPVTAGSGDVVTVEDFFGPDPNTRLVVRGYLAKASGH